MADFDKKYYKIKEVAGMLGLPPSTLRFWESKFTIIKPRRNDKGVRIYTPSDIEKLRMVLYLVKDKGLRIEAAEEQIRHNRTNVSRRAPGREGPRASTTTPQPPHTATHMDRGGK